MISDGLNLLGSKGELVISKFVVEKRQCFCTHLIEMYKLQGRGIVRVKYSQPEYKIEA